MSLATWDWPAIAADLDAGGCAVTPRLLSPAQCRDLAGLYERAELFRSTIDMARHRFGSGQYRYFKAGDWNALHRDLFGDLVFPLQVVIGLDEQVSDYTGGEFLLVEQRPRAQSRGTAAVLPQGHGLIFTTRARPVRSVRGWSAAPVRHGVSTVRSGRRHTLGLVFHDA